VAECTITAMFFFCFLCNILIKKVPEKG